MKTNRYYIILAGLLAVLAGCQNELPEETVNIEALNELRTLSASMEHAPGSNTKTYLSGPEGGIYYPFWSAKDEVAVYADGINHCGKFTLSSGEGTVKGSFSGKLTGRHLVALYPYSDKTDEGLKGNVLTLELPAEQEYQPGSFGAGAFPMVAVSDNDDLSFKNLCSVLKVSLTGSVIVTGIRFEANDSWISVSGKAEVDTGLDGAPSLTMLDDGSPEVKLNCGQVQLSNETPTDFFIVIPPGTYRGGFRIEIATLTGTAIRSTDKDIVFGRSMFRAIPAFECVAEGEIDPDNIPYTEIWYEGDYKAEFDSGVFNATIVSQTYDNGLGIIKFDAPVTEIKNDAFEWRHLTAVHLPDCVTKIGSYAFCGNELTSFKLPSQLTSLGELAFSHCPELTRFYGNHASEDGKSVVLDGRLVAYAWGAAAADEIVRVPDGVETITNLAFYDMPKAKEIIFSEGVVTIDGSSCAYMPDLERVELPGSLETIKELAFAGCKKLGSFSGACSMIADGHSIVNNGTLICFAGAGVTDYVMPESVRVLGGYSINDFSSLRSITFPSTPLEDLYNTWIRGCENLEYFYGPQVTEDNHCLVFNGEHLVATTSICPKDYVIPSGIERIFMQVFARNRTTERLVIPDEVYYIGGYCFENMTQLKTLQLPSALKQLDYCPFLNCTGLDDLYVRSYTPPVYQEDDDWTDWGHEGLTIHVPEGSENLYTSASGWSRYAKYIKGYRYTDLEKPDYYISEDYSQDGVVTTLQTASDGYGVNIVLMGDGFTDKQVADGTYDSVMQKMAEAFFGVEPYTSYRRLFNVYSVKAVSATEGYDHGGQAFGGWFGSGTLVGGNDTRCMEYAMKAVSPGDIDNTLIIVAMNSPEYAGTCYMYYPDSGDYGSGAAVAYFPIGTDDEGLAQLVHHEAGGHGFAKLADEYAYESMGTIPQSEIDNRSYMVPFGWWKNADFTDDTEKVKWAHFLADDRYKYDGLGCFEGAFTYWRGAWRPTENSIMRYNTGGFNAPSREAIWYRIHKLAYGESWEYDYEQFVSYDARNRKSALSAGIYYPKVVKPTSPPVVVGKTWREAFREEGKTIR